MVLTPIRDDGLELLELRRSFRERGQLEALELCRYRVGHGLGIVKLKVEVAREDASES